MSSKTILTEGTSAPTDNSIATVSYKGTMKIDGNTVVFDQSRPNEPFTFKIGKGQVIQCWDEQVKTMKLGEKAVIHCPSDTAYGEREIGDIPSHTDLTFEVERFE